MNLLDTKKSKSDIKTIIIAFWILLVLAAIVFVLVNVQSDKLGFFEFKVKLDNTSCVSENDNNGVIIDEGCDRLIFVDKDKKVTSIKHATTLFDNQVKYFNSFVANDYAYVHEFSFIENTEYISNETIWKYDKYGNRLGCFANFEYDNNDNRTIQPRVNTSTYYDGVYYLCMSDYINHKYSILYHKESDADGYWNTLCEVPELPNGMSMLIFAYDPDCNLIVSCDQNEEWFMYYLDQTQDKTGFIPSTEDECLSHFPTYIADNIQRSSDDLMKYSSFSPSSKFLAFSVLFWSCVVFICLSILCFLILFIISRFRVKDYKSLKYFGIGTASVLLSLFFVGFYTFNINAEKYEQTHKNLETSTNFFMELSDTDAVTNALDYYQKTGKVPPNDCFGISVYMERFMYTASKTGDDCLLLLSAADGEMLNTIASSTMITSNKRLVAENLQYLQVIKKNYIKLIDNDIPSVNGSISTPFGKFGVNCSLIKDSEGKPIGALTTGCNMNLVDKTLIQNNVILFLRLVLIFALIGFLILEIKSLIINIFRRFELSGKRSIIGNETIFTRIIVFIIYLVKRADSTLILLITKDMLDNANAVADAWIFTVPLTCITAGSLLGPVLYALFSKIFNTKPMIFIALACTAASYSGCVFAIMQNNVILLSILLVSANSFIGIIETYSNNIVLNAKNSKVRNKLNEQFTFGSICGTVLSPLIATAIVTVFGNEYIYFVSLFFLLVLFVILLIAVPKKSIVAKKLTSKTKDISRREEKVSVARFFIKPSTICVVLVLFFGVLVLGGFKSVIFPIVGDEFGMTKEQISVISTIALAIPMLATNPYSMLVKRFGDVKVITICLIFGSASFFITGLSSSLALCIYSVFITSILYVFSYNSSNSSCYEIIDLFNVSRKNALSVLLVLHGLLSLVVPPMLGVFLNYGLAFGNIIAAILILACLIISIIVLAKAGIINKFTHREEKQYEKNYQIRWYYRH